MSYITHPRKHDINDSRDHVKNNLDLSGNLTVTDITPSGNIQLTTGNSLYLGNSGTGRLFFDTISGVNIFSNVVFSGNIRGTGNSWIYGGPNAGENLTLMGNTTDLYPRLELLGGTLLATTIDSGIDFIVRNSTDNLMSIDGTSGNATLLNNIALTNGQYTAPNQPQCKVYRTAAQSIPNTTSTAMQWDNESFDTNNMHDNTTNNSRITINSPGTYSIIAKQNFFANTTGYRSMKITLNGATDLAYINKDANTFGCHLFVSTIEQLSAGDYLEVYVWQNSGSALNTGYYLENGHFAAMKVA